MSENKSEKNNQSEKLDLLCDEYVIVNWPTGKLHSQNFPYLVVKIGFGMYSPVAIPPEIILGEVSGISDWSVAFIKKHGSEGVIVVSEEDGFYFWGNGKPRGITKPPHGGTVVNWQKWLDGEIKSVDYGEGRKMIYAVGKDEDDNVYVAASEGIPREDLLAKRKELRDEKARQFQYAFCPTHLEIEGRPELSVFSYNVMFQTILDSETVITALYYPELKTYKESEETKEMKFRNEYNDKYWLKIIYHKRNGWYSGMKYRGKVFAGGGNGKDFRLFFFHLTALGAQKGEGEATKI